jgi:hypothetical protein
LLRRRHGIEEEEVWARCVPLLISIAIKGGELALDFQPEFGFWREESREFVGGEFFAFSMDVLERKLAARKFWT